MRIFDMLVAAFLGAGAATVALTALWTFWRFRRRRKAPPPVVTVETIAERVRGVGKLVGLEVFAKEIATATKGVAWMPPLLLSQARLAMIFSFRKQYFVDLARLDDADVAPGDDGHYRLRLPAIEGDLHLTDVTPYDIQDGRVLGLVDVIPMNADRQGLLMEAARGQASDLYDRNDDRYLADARRNVEKHVRSLLRLFGIEVDIIWADGAEARPAAPAEPELALAV